MLSDKHCKPLSNSVCFRSIYNEKPNGIFAELMANVVGQEFCEIILK